MISLATALVLFTDIALFITALQAGVAVPEAHIASFAVAAVLNYFFTVRLVVAAQGRTLEARVYGHVLLIALAVLFLRGGVLGWLLSWGWQPQWAIMLVALVTVTLLRVGNLLCIPSDTWTLGSGNHWRALAVAFIVFAWLLRLIYASQIELLPEETYYWNYSQHLDLGYLDHPPMVAWLIKLGTTLFGTTEFGVRFAALLAGIVTSVFVYKLTRRLAGEPTALVALVLMQMLPFFFFQGILMTPDVPMTACWAALLYYSQRALVENKASAWWGIGLALGLGMLSKYTIAMVVPAMLIFILWDARARHWLWNWRPYAAALLALAIFSPVIYWNATHEWASFAFQTTRRLAERPQFAVHKLILSALILLTPIGVIGVISGFRDRSRGSRFLWLAVLCPLAVFFFFSLRHEVKFDWTGALWLAAVPVLAWSRRTWVPTLVVLVLIYGTFFHYLVLGLPGVGYGSHMGVGSRGLASFRRADGRRRGNHPSADRAGAAGDGDGPLRDRQ
jgi:dolichol-phosphate mannosyltransferase